DAAKLQALKQELAMFRQIRETLGNRSDIAVLYEAEVKKSPFFLESEYCEKGNLLQWCESRGGILSVPLATRLDLIARIADAVTAAHQAGIVHRDIKPSNILIVEAEDGSPRPRLADFGAGRWLDHSLKHRQGLSGPTSITLGQSSHGATRMYEPPESLAGEKYTAQGDIQALRVVVCQTGVGN